MKIRKIFNNSVVSAIKDNGDEVVVMGRGLGFDKKEGDILPEARIEKVFVMDKKSNDKFKKLLEDISFEHLRISDEIITMATAMIGKRLSEKVYITLTDHISYAIERQKEGVFLRNAMLFEIKNFYGSEFAAGQKALEMIKAQFDVELPEDEAGFIALHFVNAELDSSMEHMKDLTILIRGVLDIVRYQFKINFDESSLDYSRFVTHLRYLGQRVFMNKPLKHEDAALVDMVRSSYPEAYACAEKISAYIEKQFLVRISEDDKVFLSVHIRRLTSERG